MAIQDAFNISQARSNQAYAYKCWYNYNYENNTMGIPSSAMGEIVTQYNSVLDKWKAVATNDENKYEISDDDFNAALDNGYKDAAKDAGYEGGGKTGMIFRGVIDSTAGLAGAAAVTIGQKFVTEKVAKKAGAKIGAEAAKGATANFVKNAAQKSAQKAFEKAGGTAAGEAATEAAKKSGEKVTNAGKSVAWIVAAPLALATGTAYQAKKPNKDQYNAAMELMNTILPDAQAQTVEAQAEMEDADAELIELTDEADTVNEDTNDEIEENKSEFDLYKESYDALIKKVESGEALTQEEKELLKQLVPLMQQLGEDISTLSDDTIEYIQGLYADMKDYQDYFDDAAEMIANVQGITDYAESFDQTAQTMMYVEAGAQTLNAGSGTKAAIQAGKFAASGGIFTAWAWAFVAFGTTGAFLSGRGALEQMGWASETGAEIDLRTATQDLNSATTDIYDERIEDYEGYMETVGDLEIEIPDDIEAPEEVEVPEDNGETDGTNTTDGTTRGANNSNSNTDPTKTDIGQNDDYQAVMGYGADYTHIIRGDMPLEQGTVLVNNKNKVVLQKSYSDAITAVTGDDSGKRFSSDKVPAVIANLLPEPFDEKMIKQVMNGKKLDSEYSAKLINAVSGKQDGTTTVDNTDKATTMAKQVINFYSAIFKAAANRGWTNGTSADLEGLKKVKVG